MGYMKDGYARALERALANWYHIGDDAPPEHVFNALSEGRRSGMQMLVPIEIPEAVLEKISAEGELREGMSFSFDEDVPISFCHIPIGDGEKYLIPLFTSEEQMEKGEAGSAINQPFAALLDALDNLPECVGYVINPYSDKLLVDHGIRDMIVGFEPKSYVSFVKGSVLDMKVDAVVNSAHRTLLGGRQVDEILLAEADGGYVAEAFLCGGGLNGAIHEAAGKELFDECRSLGGCEIGTAKITGAYGINGADHIIHTVGPVYEGEESGEETERLLASCYRSVLDVAAENGCRSVAFPCISAGACGYPVWKAAATAIITVVEWFEEHPDIVMNVYMCAFTENEYKSFMNMIKK